MALSGTQKCSLYASFLATNVQQNVMHIKFICIRISYIDIVELILDYSSILCSHIHKARDISILIIEQ